MFCLEFFALLHLLTLQTVAVHLAKTTIRQNHVETLRDLGSLPYSEQSPFAHDSSCAQHSEDREL